MIIEFFISISATPSRDLTEIWGGTCVAINPDQLDDEARCVLVVTRLIQRKINTRSDVRGNVHFIRQAECGRFDRVPARSILHQGANLMVAVEGTFKEVAQAPEDSRFERYKAAVRQSNGSTVEVLTVEVMKDMCELAEDDAMKATMEDRVVKLSDAMVKLSKMEPSVPTEEAGHNFTNRGHDQINAPGGTVNRSEGTGNHFPGATFSGSVTFGKN